MKKIKKNIILLACCITLFSSFVVSATSASNSITNGAATLTGSARMYDYSKKKDKCIMTAAFGGGKATEATSGSISGKIQGIDVKAKRMDTGNLNKKNKTYSDSKIVSDAYCVFTVTISLKGADSKEIYAHD